MEERRSTEINIEEVRKKRRKTRRFKLLGKWLAVLLLIMGVYCIATGKVNRWFQRDSSGISFVYAADSRASFYISDRGIFHASKDGLKYYELKDLNTWRYNDTFSMTSPTIYGTGNYVGVFDYKGTQFGVYGEDGALYATQADAPIIYMSVNKNGWAVIMTEDSQRRVVSVYNTVGTWVAGAVYVETHLYPLTACLSDDERILAVSLLDTGEGSNQQLASYISLYYINKSEGLDYKDNIFFSLEKKESIIPYLYFNGDNTLFCVGDSELFLIDTNNAVEQWSKPYPNMLSKVDFTNGYLAIAYGQPFSGAGNGYPVGTVHVYNEKGNIAGEFFQGEEVTYLYAKGNVIVGYGRNFYSISTKGKLEWEYKATLDVSQLLGLSQKNALLVSKNEASIVSLQNQALEEQPFLEWDGGPSNTADEPPVPLEGGTQENEELENEAGQDSQPLDNSAGPVDNEGASLQDGSE